MSKKPPEAEKENAERWVLSYADLITLLLGFFIILYASAEVDLERFEAISIGLSGAFNVPVDEGADGGGPLFSGGRGLVTGPVNTGRIDTDLDFIQTTIAEREAQLGISGQIRVTRDEDRITIRLADNLVFPPASADIREDALPLLDIVGAVVREFDNELRVEGHTDNIPVGSQRYPSNWELSSARATAVLRYLVEQNGVQPERTFAGGFGEFRPVVSNLTPEGRALNRRADVVLLYPHAVIESGESDDEPVAPDLDPGLRPGRAIPPLPGTEQ